jgi:hypothetical protein
MTHGGAAFDDRELRVPRTQSIQASSRVDTWLTARVGAHWLLSGVLGDRLGSGQPVRFVDDAIGLTKTTFFRAPAQLCLPDSDVKTVGIAALVVRPGGRSTHLVVRGPYAWETHADAALGAVEDIVRVYHEQWTPFRALWSGPAEELLAGEVR